MARSPQSAEETALRSAKPAVEPRRRRMAPQDREDLIVREATRYFAEFGLSAGTIDLARRIGITQPLLYRYFPTKESLIEKVYDSLFPSHRAPDWERLLGDATLPLRDRLKEFYTEYAEKVLTYEHVRLFLFSGLSKFDYNTRYYELLTRRVFLPIALALRMERQARDPLLRFPDAVGSEEIETVQTLHGSIYHVAFRRFVYTPPLEADIPAVVGIKVDIFLDGVFPKRT